MIEQRQFNYSHLLKSGRRVGNSSRQVDYIIQYLFENINGWVPVVDHFSIYNTYSTSTSLNKMLLDKVIKRLKSEYNIEDSKYEIKLISGKIKNVENWHVFEDLNKLLNNQRYYLIKLK